MGAKLQFAGKEHKIFYVELKSELAGEGVKFPNSTDEMLHNQFKITVTLNTVSGEGATLNKVSRNFNFYDSFAAYEAGKQHLTEENLKWAFRCFIEDANSGTIDFEDFCSGFGLDTDSRRAEKIWQDCRNNLIKLEELGFSEDELPDIINELSEQGVE